MSESLTEFLLARIAEDEAVARDVIEQHARDHGPAAIIDETWARPYMNPARVLAECETKRRIVGLQPLNLLGGAEERQAERLRGHVLRLMALPYADHPDCREEWKP